VPPSASHSSSQNFCSSGVTLASSSREMLRRVSGGGFTGTAASARTIHPAHRPWEPDAPSWDERLGVAPVERHQAAVRRHHVHHAVHHQRRRLRLPRSAHAQCRTRIKRPGLNQPGYVAGVDLAEQRIAGVTRVAAIGWPIRGRRCRRGQAGRHYQHACASPITSRPLHITRKRDEVVQCCASPVPARIDIFTKTTGTGRVP
jgi:hypothetical protein